MTSNNGWELHGPEKQRTDRSGEIWRRATSSSGGTQPRYKSITSRIIIENLENKCKMSMVSPVLYLVTMDVNSPQMNLHGFV